MSLKTLALGLALGLALAAAACGRTSKTADDERTGDPAALTGNAPVGLPQAEGRSGDEVGSTSTSTTTATATATSTSTSTTTATATSAGAGAVEFSCLSQKTAEQYVTGIALDLFRRGPSDSELAMAADPSFDQEKFVDWALTQPDYLSSGVAWFVSNLLRINENLSNQVDPKNPTSTAAIIADLESEPVQFVQKHLNEPWGTMFTATDFACTANTGPLYGYPVDPNVAGFVDCKMEPQRAGILGLVSVLRAYSSAFYLQNNNYHRNALAVYLAWGLQLAAKTNGPSGGSDVPPLPSCVPEVDTRVSPAGLVFGTAAVPHSGVTCAGCHLPFHAEMVSGFLPFGPDGSILQLSDIDKLQPSDTVGIDTKTLKNILSMSGTSCWSSTSSADPPQMYQGLPGLGRLIATSPKLPKALAIQIQQNWMNVSPTDAATAAIVDGYNQNGGTLAASLKAYLLSGPYTCAKAAE